MRLAAIFAACLWLAACGDPIADIPRLSDQDIPEDSGSVDVAAAPATQETGLFQLLLGGSAQAAGKTEDAPDTSPENKADPDNTPRRGLFSLFRGMSQSAGEPEVVPASLPDPGRAGPSPTSEIEPGTTLPYGRVARICGLGKRDMGKQIAAHPENRPVHRIYDSDPGNTSPHSFYVTGFRDGCARQFTASLAVFGSVAMHEQLRYGLPAEVQPYSGTDKAYEKVKSRACGVPRKKPCGSQLSRLDRSTVFVSIYERFGSNPDWTNLLLHDGDLVAQDSKGG